MQGVEAIEWGYKSTLDLLAIFLAALSVSTMMSFVLVERMW
jgi:hypothetical protein